MNGSMDRKRKLISPQWSSKRPWNAEFHFPKRPTSNAFDRNDKPIVFMLTTIDEYMSKQKKPVIRLYGVTAAREVVTVNVHDFLPYLYVEAPKQIFSDEDLGEFTRKLEIEINRVPKQYWQKLDRYVINTKSVRRRSIRGYTTESRLFLQITVASPKIMSMVKNVLIAQKFLPFEANVKFPMRFMIDHDIRGAGWIELRAHKYDMNSQIDISCRDVIARNDISSIAPIEVLSFDIECAGRPGVFPEADTDPVIQIGNRTAIYGQDETIHNVVFTLNATDDIQNARICACGSEEQMLLEWANFVRVTDPGNHRTPRPTPRCATGVCSGAHIAVVVVCMKRTAAHRFRAHRSVYTIPSQ